MMMLEIAAKAKSIIDKTTHVYKIVNSIDRWSESEKQDFIDESFFNIINYSYRNIPYYHKLFIENGINPKSFTEISKITEIPILTKDIIRSNYEDLQPRALNKLRFQTRRSGGTTGEPIKSLVSDVAAAYETFTYFKGLKWMGFQPDMTFVKIFGGSLGIGKSTSFRKKIYQYSTNSVLIPAFELRPETVINYFKLVKYKKKICLIGYASAINIMVDLLKERNLLLENVKLVITTSEQLTADWEYNIKSYFNCAIRSYYGSGEIGSLGYQELGGNEYYRIPLEHVNIENNPKSQELYITQLHNLAQPLIRYSIGDLGTVSEKNPKFITRLSGRTADMFIRKSGVEISPDFGAHAILKTGIPVQQYQYIQYSDLIIEFRYFMEKGELTSDHKEVLQSIIDYVMGEPTVVFFNETEDFVINNSGKHRITVRMNSKYSS